MAGSTVTIPVVQFVQQLRQKYPQYSSVPDDKLVAGFVSKNPRFTANYQDETIVSVSYEPAAAAAPAQKPGVTALVQPPMASAAVAGASQVVAARPATETEHDSGSGPVAQQGAGAGVNAAEATVLSPAGAVASTSGAGAGAAQRAPVPVSPDTPYLGNTIIVNVPAEDAPLMVGKYQVVDELGRGGMGIVYKAFDPGIGRTVALKVMSEQLASDTGFRERFLREARGAGILQHPNIVTVHELGEWQGAPFIAMEFLQGRSLEDILKNEKTMPLEKRLDIVAQVCRGLDYAHARGIVHRDIKPANVMVTTDGVAKVVDFGIARLADQKLTNTGHVLGTVSYMSPEQLQGKTLDGRSDIFAVGVMLFEALTSVLPFAAENTGAAITNTLYRQPPSLSNFLANYPKELDEVVSKCLAKDPAERFQTADELAERLSQIQQELRQSHAAPTVIRTTPMPSDPADQAPMQPASSSDSPTGVANLGVPSIADAGQQLRQAASQSANFAKEWWRVASPRGRSNAITIGIPIVLYLIGLTTSSDAANVIVLPVAILGAIIIGIQVWGKRWTSSPANAQAFIGVTGFILAAYCVHEAALGLSWYFVESKILLILVTSLLLIFGGANAGFVRELWTSATRKVRAISTVAAVLLAGYFVVALVSYQILLNRPVPAGLVNKQPVSAGGSGPFDRGGYFEQYESAPNGVWTDPSVKGLMWMSKDRRNTDWSGAVSFCRASRASGYSDWRVPTVSELKTVFDPESNRFQKIKQGLYISSSIVWSNEEMTAVSFATDGTAYKLDSATTGSALCVRVDNGQAPTQTAQSKPTWPEIRGAYTAGSSGDNPAFPDILTGYRSEDGKDFWGHKYPSRGTLRVVGTGDGWAVLYPRFPATMNGCSSGVFMIRWRSAYPDVLVRSALGPDPSEDMVASADLIAKDAAKSSASFGYMYGTNCDQPMFKFDRSLSGNGTNLVDIYYELKFWQAAP